MLHIFAKDYDGSTSNVTWQVGQPLPLLPSGNLLNELNVLRVQADGEELNYIKAFFIRLPMATFRIGMFNWYGHHAKFIVGNLI